MSYQANWVGDELLSVQGSRHSAVEQADAVVRFGKLPVKKLAAKPFPGCPTLFDRPTAFGSTVQETESLLDKL